MFVFGLPQKFPVLVLLHFIRPSIIVGFLPMRESSGNCGRQLSSKRV